jgi:carboxypeptidase family protein
MKELDCHCAHHAYALRFLAAFSILLSLTACRPGTPVVDLGPKPPTVDGTISGTVRGPEGTSAIEGRTVDVINTATGERQRATTNSAGGFTFKVKPGKYRVELTLIEGESLVKHPDVINVNKSDVDAHADFVVSASRVSGRRHRPRGDDGLGSPIA